MAPHLFYQTINADACPAGKIQRGKTRECGGKAQGKTFGTRTGAGIRINCPYKGVGRREGIWKGIAWNLPFR